MSLSEAVAELIPVGAGVGIGGQNLSRCSVALAHEIIRQGIHSLTLYGCNLSIQADMLIGAGLVRHCECGTANVERFGVAYRFAHAVEQKLIGVSDYDHATMLARFKAGSAGLPFMPVLSGIHTDLYRTEDANLRCLENPFTPGTHVVLAQALRPDVAVVHAQYADEDGNVVISGAASHDPEMLRASKVTLVTVEQILPSGKITQDFPGTVISHHHITAVVCQPFGAWPTSVHAFYDHDSEQVRMYQRCAKVGGEAYREYLDRFIRKMPDFSSYLRAAKGGRGSSGKL